MVGHGTPADAVAGLKQNDTFASGGQAPSCGNTCCASTDNCDIECSHADGFYAGAPPLVGAPANMPGMTRLDDLLGNNRRWAENITREDPRFFARLVEQQSPRYLWIGCADSRVPANEIVDLAPGELFVHRNVANLVVHTDLNCLSVIQYAVDVLKVQDIIVTGHYGCGGIAAAMGSASLGLIDNWLRHVQDIRDRHPLLLAGGGQAAVDRLSELNVLEQALNVCRTTVVKDAWCRGQSVAVHGLIYSVEDGLLKDLHFCGTGDVDSTVLFDAAVARLAKL
jgi:carbonic anhydrase